MEKHNRLTNLDFELQFKTCIMHPSVFTHEAHLRLAYIHIAKYGMPEAVRNLPHQILKYATSLGDKEKFNATVTVAAIKAVYHFMLKAKSDNFYDFIREFPELKFNFKELLGFHYAFDIFISKEAKASYQDPDLLPFD